MSRWFFILLCLSFGCSLCGRGALNALMLDETFDSTLLKGKRVGYYIGSFDPLHLGHQQVIDSALQEGHVDYVLVYPVPGGDAFKNRSELSRRVSLVASVYQEHPRVLLTTWTPKRLQDYFTKMRGEVEVVGMVGSDVVTEQLMGPDEALSERYLKVFMRGIPLNERHYEDTIGALMALKADSFLVALRGNVDLSYLEGKVHDRPIRGFMASTDYSSTEVRKAIGNHSPFDHFLDDRVAELIKREGWYGCP